MFFDVYVLFSVMCVKYLVAICENVSKSLHMLWEDIFTSLRQLTSCISMVSLILAIVMVGGSQSPPLGAHAHVWAWARYYCS